MPRSHRTPISRIPPELLAEILLICAPLKYDIVSERRSILYPSQVCHYWRSAALSTPALWSFILFRCEWREAFPREAECARVWLSRSSQCPLSIEVDAGTSQDRAEAALQILIPHCTRWKAIDTKLIVLDPHVWSQVTGKLPLLESVNLFYGAARDSFAIAPRLQHLRLQVAQSFRFKPVKLPWTQLVHLELNIIDDYGKSHIHTILQQASNIATFKICALRRIPMVHHPESTILTHPNISTFEILGDDNNLIEWFLDGLALPALRVLSLPNLSALVLPQWKCAASLLSRSGCNLSSLDTRIDSMYDCILLEHFPRNDSLAHLRVSFLRVADWVVVVRCLMHQHNMPPFNNLRSLEMHLAFTPSGHKDMDLFADMVASRWRRVDADVDPESARCATLSHVKLFVEQDISMHHVAISRLRTFAAEGLDIKVRSYHEQYV